MEQPIRRFASQGQDKNVGFNLGPIPEPVSLYFFVADGFSRLQSVAPGLGPRSLPAAGQSR